MKERGKIASIVLGFTLSLVFLFPSIYKFHHLFENHQHVACKESKVHFHEKTVDCQINLFHFSSFGFTLTSYELDSFTINTEKGVFFYQERLIPFDKRFIKLRGPPVVAV